MSNSNISLKMGLILYHPVSIIPIFYSLEDATVMFDICVFLWIYVFWRSSEVRLTFSTVVFRTCHKLIYTYHIINTFCFISGFIPALKVGAFSLHFRNHDSFSNWKSSFPVLESEYFQYGYYGQEFEFYDSHWPEGYCERNNRDDEREELLIPIEPLGLTDGIFMFMYTITT